MSSQALSAINQVSDAIRNELAKIVVGQQEAIDHLMVAMLADQHCMLEATPGSGKNMLAAALAKALGLSFCRVHCTEDLSPAELVSLAILASNNHSGADKASPILPHMLLIDDISRLGPRRGIARADHR